MPGGNEVRNVSNLTGRYSVKTTDVKVQNGDSQTKITTETIKFYAKDGTQLKAGYYNAAEAKDLAYHNGYGKWYDVKCKSNNGKFYLEITAKSEFPVGMLAEDFLIKGTVNKGTIKANNPKFFEGYNCLDDAGHQMSDLNKPIKKGEKINIPIENVEIKDSPIGWFRRKIMSPMY